MLKMGLTVTERRSFEAALRQPHRFRVRVLVLDRNEAVVGDLSSLRVLTGAVQFDTTQAPARTASLTLLDPTHRLKWIPDSPSSAGVYADNFLSISRGIYVDELSRWVDVPVFTGPLIRASRAGAEATVEAAGKEVLALAPVVAFQRPTNGRLIPKGTKVTTAIRRIMEDTGEAHFELPDLATRLPEAVSIGRSTEPWKVVRRLAASVNRQVFYDGRGRVRLRLLPKNVVFTFRIAQDDDPSTAKPANVNTRPTLIYDVSRIRNVVEALGPEPEGSAVRVRAVAIAPRTHPLNPYALARNGAPRWLVETVEGEWKRKTDAQTFADDRLADLLRAEVDVQTTVLPTPHLEEGDLVGLAADDVYLEHRLSRFTIPLEVGSDMSIGYLKRVSPRRRKVKT